MIPQENYYHQQMYHYFSIFYDSIKNLGISFPKIYFYLIWEKGDFYIGLFSCICWSHYLSKNRIIKIKN